VATRGRSPSRRSAARARRRDARLARATEPDAERERSDEPEHGEQPDPTPPRLQIERVEQRAHVRPACRRLPRETLDERAVDRGRHVASGRLARLAGAGPREPTRAAPERMSTMQGQPQRDTEGILITAIVDRTTLPLLGRHEGRRAEDGAGDRQVLVGERERGRHVGLDEGRVRLGVARHGVERVARRLERPARRAPRREPAREPEVEHEHALVGGHDHVVGLEVAMHDAGSVRGMEPAPRRDEAREDVGGRARRSAEPLPEVGPVDELHRDIEVALGLAEVVDGRDVGVPESRHRLCLAAKSLMAMHVAVRIATEQLDRDLAIELGVPRGMHDTHAALADALEQHVAPERGATLGRAGHAGLHAGVDERPCDPCRARTSASSRRRPRSLSLVRVPAQRAAARLPVARLR
jgi:hypothetical protein